MLQHLQKVFHIRNCRDGFFAHRSRPCLQHQIGRCSAPCVGLISVTDYRRDLEAGVAVLEGRSAEVSDELQQRMAQAAEARDYETAALARDHSWLDARIETALPERQPRVEYRRGAAEVGLLAMMIGLSLVPQKR